MENLELCQKCRGECCKNNTGAYDCMPCSKEEFEQRLGSDFVICCDILLNPAVFGVKDVSKIIPMDEIEAKKVRDFKVFNYLISKGFVTDRTIIKIFYTVKPRGVNDYKITQIYDIDNVCSFLTNKGCKLNHDDRPYECRELVPKYINGKFSCRSCNDSLSCEYHIIDNMIEYQEYLNNIAYETAKQIVKDIKNGKLFENKIDTKELLNLAESIIENNESSGFEF